MAFCGDLELARERLARRFSRPGERLPVEHVLQALTLLRRIHRDANEPLSLLPARLHVLADEAATSSVLERTSASSMPTAPYSLMMTALPRPSGVARNRRNSVVFPAPRNPVTIVTGSREPRSRFCRRPKRLCDAEGNRSKMVSDI